MRYVFLLTLATMLVGATLRAQITITSGSHLTINANSVLTVINADVDLKAGGTLTNQGIVYTNQTFTTAGTLITEVSGTTPGVDFGRITADVNADLNGTFTATKTAGYNPAGLVSHVIVLSGNIPDMFGSENLPGTNWELDYMPTALDLVYNETLPVTWLSFSGESVGKRIDLYWATASEDNSDFFAVERQTATDSWQEIGRVAAAGNSQTPRQYTFPDDAPGPTNPVHYRLRQVDLDGRFDYSAVVVVRRPDFAEGLVYPNPSPGKLSFRTAGGNIPYQIFDLRGGEVLTGLTDGELTQIRLPGSLKNGVYLLRVGEEVFRFEVIR